VRSRIILPDKDGVASLEIKRMERELDKNKPEPKVDGYFPVQAKRDAMRQLQNALKGIEKGTVSAMCLVVIHPTGSHSSMVAASICCNDFEFGKLADVTLMALESRDPDPGDPDDEAG